MLRGERGQSSVEIALALPILLLLALGLADLGRWAHYAISLSHAARDSASYAAAHQQQDQAAIWKRACREMGFDDPSAECNALNVTLERGIGGVASDSKVTVKYQFRLITGMITERVWGGPVELTATATFPGYTQ